MSLSEQFPAASFVGDGDQTTFDFDFRVLDDDDLDVYLDEAQVTTGYSVSLDGDNGGTVTFAVAPDASVVVRLNRSTSRTQPAEYAPNTAFPATAHERALDRIVMEVQDVHEITRRAALLRVPSPLRDLVIDEPVAGANLRWSDSGTVIESASTDLPDSLTFTASGGGAVSRTVQVKLSDHLNAADFGFHPDNSAGTNSLTSVPTGGCPASMITAIS